MNTFLTVLHVMVCLVIIVVVLLQRGKGAEIGAVFGGGASSTVFGSRGAGNFLSKITTGAAITFMCTSMALAYFNAEARQGEKLFDDTGIEETAPAETGAEAAPEPPAEPAPAESAPENPAPPGS